jgi:predicted branched-subunit amino acid permease
LKYWIKGLRRNQNAADPLPNEDSLQDRSVFLATLPLALAIAVFGMIYGALARPIAGAWLTVTSSAVIFSGAVQFATTGLLLTDASITAVVAIALTLNLRNLLLGAVLRPKLSNGPLERAGLAWFLLDESFGLAVATRGDAAKTLVVSGFFCYAAWVGGTAIGVLGGSIPALTEAAGAVFPVLFIGLAAISSRTLSVAARAIVAALITAAASILWPGARGFVPVAAAILVALPGKAE